MLSLEKYDLRKAYLQIFFQFSTYKIYQSPFILTDPSTKCCILYHFISQYFRGETSQVANTQVSVWPFL